MFTPQWALLLGDRGTLLQIIGLFCSIQKLRTRREHANGNHDRMARRGKVTPIVQMAPKGNNSIWAGCFNGLVVSRFVFWILSESNDRGSNPREPLIAIQPKSMCCHTGLIFQRHVRPKQLILFCRGILIESETIYSMWGCCVVHFQCHNITFSFFRSGVSNPLSPYGAGWRSASDHIMSCGSC